MQLHASESSSFSDLMAQKQSAGVRKFEALRSMSDADRAALNERSGAVCQKIASEFGKSRRLVL
jgi:hypothetical protein